MNVLKIDNKEWKGPSAWKEMTSRQVSLFFSLDFTKPLHVLRLQIVHILFGITFKKILSINAADLPKLDALFQWALKDEKLFKNPFPKIIMAGTELIGPADNLENLRFSEWIFADSFFSKYIAASTPLSTKEETLDLLIATLWREKKPQPEIESNTFNGDERVRFNKFIVERRLPMVRRISAADKSMLFFIRCSRQMIIIRNPDLFIQKTTPGEGGTWIDVLLSIAGGKFGTVYETEDALLSEVFFELKRMIKK